MPRDFYAIKVLILLIKCLFHNCIPVLILFHFVTEMPGLMLLRKRNCTDKPLEGAKIVACTHVTAQAAVSFRLLYCYVDLYCQTCIK